MTPETRYARSGDVNLAYQVVGEGPLDLVYVTGWVSNIELAWEEPTVAAFLDRLASFARLITFDKRGTGLSDRVPNSALPTLEERMDDVRAVMDAAGSERAALFGVSEGGPMCALFAATYPDRTSALAMYGTYARRTRSKEYPWAPSPEQRQRFYEAITGGWGGVVDLDSLAPSVSKDARFAKWWASYLRNSSSPGAALALARMNTEIDVSAVLPLIPVPTLLLHRVGDMDIDIGGARYMAEHIPGARLVELEGNDHLPFAGDAESILGEVEEFLTGIRHGGAVERILSTILFTDVVGSTERAVQLGDRAWRDLKQRHDAAVREQLERHRGREIDNAGDGFCASFDGPARAVRCAFGIRAALAQLGLEVRAGVHTGECELLGDRLAGLAVHVAARIAASAEPGTVRVSSTVTDLVAGSGLKFESLGRLVLKGVPGDREVFAAS